MQCGVKVRDLIAGRHGNEVLARGRWVGWAALGSWFLGLLSLSRCQSCECQWPSCFSVQTLNVDLH